MTLSEYISAKKPLLQEHLLSFLQEKKSANTSELAYYTDVINRLENFSCQGKMMRGILILFAQEMFGGTHSAYSMNCASAIELAHSGLLIHDDIIDNDNLRRGNKTIFAQFEDEAIKNGYRQSHFYGQSMGICSGDIAFFLVYELLSQNATHDHPVSEITSLFSQTLQTVAAAEMHDFHLGFTEDEAQKDEIMQIYRTKTAHYTFSTPLKIGALLAGTDRTILEKLDEMGEYLGIVFQMKDDEIGITASEDVIGKPVGSDIRENKKTYIRTLLFESITVDERKKLKTIFGNENITLNEIDYVKHLLDAYKIHERMEQIIREYSENAGRTLDLLPIDKSYKTVFKELIAYNISRAS